MGKTFQIGSNPFRFLGVSYQARMYALKEDPRPSLVIHLGFKTVWLKLPWKHVQDKSYGSFTKAWGFVHSLKNFYGHVSFGDKVYYIYK